ncbi:MAG: Asp23/Gls24 family envelope stress response protein, partial [Candidatus Omnitrophica bacterium]|nr:Asp23/Gls24 family envelope stress response protein [Candidatus Omnitrophota bacterium]
TCGIVGSIAEAFGYKNYPAVTVSVDKDTQVSVEIRVIIYYGLNIPHVARQIQDVIARAVTDAVDINLKEINVNIQAVERPNS